MSRFQASSRRRALVRAIAGPIAILMLLAMVGLAPANAQTTGVEWSHPEVIAAPDTFRSAKGVAQGPAGSVAVEATPMGEDIDMATTMWFSADGFDWEEVAAIDDVGLTSVIHAHGMYIAVGRRDLGDLQSDPRCGPQPKVERGRRSPT